MTEQKYRVLIGLDRDGTINHDPGYLGKDENWKEQIKLLPGVIEGIVALKQLPKTKVIVCSNQAGVARRFFDPTRVDEINDYMNELLEKQGASIENWYFCPYVDENYAFKKGISGESSWVVNTDLRKPGIGMLRKAANDLGMKLEDFEVVIVVGDKASDVKTGLNARGYGIYLSNGNYPEERDKVSALEAAKNYEGKVFVANDLQDAAKTIKLITRLNGVLK